MNNKDVRIINFAHPLTESQLAQISMLTGRNVSTVINSPVQLDLNSDVVAQTRSAVDAVPLNPEQWQNEPFVVNLPGLSSAAAIVIADIHGRCGYFPSICQIRRTNGDLPEFEVSQIIALQSVREDARTSRKAPDQVGE